MSVSVRPEVARVISRLVYGRPPRKPRIRDAVALSYGQVNLTHRCGPLRVWRGFLRVDVARGPSTELLRLYSAEQAEGFDRVVRASLRGGGRAGGTALGLSFSTGEGTASIDCGDWWAWSTFAPRIWVGAVEGVHGCPRGNLRLVDDGGREVAVSLGLHLAFSAPGAMLYLVDARQGDLSDGGPTQGPFMMIVDCSDPEPPSGDLLRGWFRALSFTLGSRIAIRELVGIDEHGAVAGRLGVLMREGAKRPFMCHGATPTNGAGPAFAVPFFEAIVRREPAPIWPLAADYYLASFEDHPTEAYVKMVTALEGLADEIGQGTETRRRLEKARDPREWERFVDDTMPSLLGHFRPEDRASVERRFRELSSVSATQRIPGVFKALGLTWPGWAREQHRKWNAPRHGRMLPRASSLDDVAQLRALLVALIAKWAGYDGPIVGWKLHRYGVYGAADPAWWKPGEAIVAEHEAIVTPHSGPSG